MKWNFPLARRTVPDQTHFMFYRCAIIFLRFSLFTPFALDRSAINKKFSGLLSFFAFFSWCAIIVKDEKFLCELIQHPSRTKRAIEWVRRLIHEMKNLTFYPLSILWVIRCVAWELRQRYHDKKMLLPHRSMKNVFWMLRNSYVKALYVAAG